MVQLPAMLLFCRSSFFAACKFSGNAAWDLKLLSWRENSENSLGMGDLQPLMTGILI